MSLSLDCDTSPEGFEVRTFLPGRIWIGQGPGNFMGHAEIDMSIRDFCEMVKYVMTNTDLEKSDPRIGLLAAIAQYNVVDGYSEGKKRLA